MTTMIKSLNVLGLMAGTSLDGIKVSLISTDGIDIYDTLLTRRVPYPDSLREKIYAAFGKRTSNQEDKDIIDAAEAEITDFMIDIINEIKNECPDTIDLVGIEGPTICHDPETTYTYQLGNGREIAQKTGFKIVTHFHNADILNGGQGAPITATYYSALAQNIEKPNVFINIGGITNLIWTGHLGEITAFDCGPGNALIDDWVFKHAGMHMDYNGKLAATGHIHEKIVAQMMRHDFFAKYPPKSLDRNLFNNKTEHLEGLSPEDGAATATAFVAEAIAYSLAFYLPEVPVKAIICGGGANNPTLNRFIRQKLKDMDIETVPDDFFAAEINDASATAFLAARRLYNLPITFPTTTGIGMPIPGGEIYEKEIEE